MFKRLADGCLERTGMLLSATLLAAALLFAIPSNSAFAACTVVNGACGAAAATCNTGTLTGDGGQVACGTTHTWGCLGSGGGTTASCTKANAGCPFNGVCGGSANTCSTGSPSGYSAGSCGGSQTWTCNGANGGSNASCSTPKAACPVNGSCNNGVAWACNAGTPANGVDAGCGDTRTWQCLGANGGSNSGTCSKANAACSGCSAGVWLGWYVLDSCTSDFSSPAGAEGATTVACTNVGSNGCTGGDVAVPSGKCTFKCTSGVWTPVYDATCKCKPATCHLC